jgi:predicted esterase
MDGAKVLCEKLIDIVFEDEQTLLGVLHSPKKLISSKKPCVIMFYGFNGSREEAHRISVKFARRLIYNNIACFRFDYLGCSISSGEFYEYTIEDRIYQGIKVIQYLINNENIDQSNITVIGFSDGARVALGVSHILKEMSINVNSILWSPVIVDEPKSTDKYNEVPVLTRNKITKSIDYSYLGLYVQKQYFEPLGNNYIEKFEKLISSNNVLCIFGGSDKRNIQTKSEIKSQINMYSQSLAQVYDIVNASHLFDTKEWQEELFNVTVSFLEKITSREVVQND